jgi:hypothetical protein
MADLPESSSPQTRTFDFANPPQMTDMNTFWSIAEDYGGLAKACRYMVRINAPTAVGPVLNGDLSYLCESTEFPGRAFQNVDMRYYGPSFKLPYLSDYDDINMTFLCRTGAQERMFFDNWMEVINPSVSYNFEYRDNYRSTITMYQLGEWPALVSDMAPQAHYAFTLYDAFPILVNPQPITWADDSFLRLTVTFTFSKWRRKGIDPESRVFTTMVERVPSERG